jgi:regulator of sigma E protease
MNFWNGVVTVLSTALVFGVLIFIHEFGHFITARLCGVGVKEFAIGMGPKLFSWKSKKYDTVYGLRALPIGGFVSMVGEDEESNDDSAFCNKPVWKRMVIVLAGAAMNLLLGFLLMSIIVVMSKGLASTTIAEFVEGAASSQYLQVEDKIVAVEGVPVFTGDGAAYEIMNQGYEPIDITVIRNGERIVVKDVVFGSFEESGVTFGDYDFKFYAEAKNPLNLLKHAFFRSLSTVKMVVDSVISLITGRFGFEAVSGPVGVAGAVGDAVRSGTTSFLYLSTVLTVNLGVFNLIPFPALDGGRFLFLCIEAIRKKPIKREVEGFINLVGITLLFILMIVIMGKDIIQLF